MNHLPYDICRCSLEAKSCPKSAVCRRATDIVQDSTRPYFFADFTEHTGANGCAFFIPVGDPK